MVINVLPDVPGGFIIGFSVLSRVDVFVARDANMIGVFDAGIAPVDADALAIELVTYAEGVSYVDGFVATAEGDRFHDAVPLLIDTGATTTRLPISVLAGRARLHTRAAATVAGDIVTEHYDAGGIFVGRTHVSVGRVVPTAAAVGYGTLGLDVIGRFHVVFSARRARAFLTPRPRRPAFRTLGPDGAARDFH